MRHVIGLISCWALLLCSCAGGAEPDDQIEDSFTLPSAAGASASKSWVSSWSGSPVRSGTDMQPSRPGRQRLASTTRALHSTNVPCVVTVFGCSVTSTTKTCAPTPTCGAARPMPSSPELPSPHATLYRLALGSIGIVIGLGVAIGKLLEVSGAADALARAFLRGFGKDREEWAMGTVGSLVSIPVFCDSGYVIMNPLARSIARVKRGGYVALALALGCGMTLTHHLVPPTPGPLAATGGGAAICRIGGHVDHRDAARLGHLGRPSIYLAERCLGVRLTLGEARAPKPVVVLEVPRARVGGGRDQTRACAGGPNHTAA